MDGLYEQFRIALHSVWRRRWLALAVAWGLCLAGWLVIALIPNIYQSRARVFAQMQSILPEQIGITAAERQRDLLRVKQTLTSTENLEKVVRRTDLNQLVASDRDLAAQVEALRENIDIVAQQDNLFEISATSGIAGFSNAENARTAAAIVQNLLDLFVEENLSGNRAETGETLAFLDEELRQRQSELQQAEQRRMEFEARFLAALPGQGSIAERVSAARVELAGIEQQLVAERNALNAIRSQMAGTPPTIAMPGYASAGGPGYAGAQIAALEGQLTQFKAKGWTDSHPDVLSVRSQIARLQQQAASDGVGGSGAGSTPNPAYVSMGSMAAEKEARVAAASARKAQLESGLAQISSLQTSQPDAAAEQARLDRDYEVLRRQYEELLGKREQVSLRSDVQTKTDAIDFRIIDPPSRPAVPAAPNRPLLLSMILLVAIAGGIGTAFAKAQLQTTFPTQNRLEQATGLPVLGSVREIFTAEALAGHRQRLKWFVGAGGALAASYALLMLVEFWQRSTVA
ncbi:XrtA system polysaccharide chain length determinant [Allosphingosinicella sp.]|uniref:XrtA system polysaccharide chain length determinant n=1 Tax=Allosphingosinicella sp. TaxID=2823234 RepID=UPI002FC249C4